MQVTVPSSLSGARLDRFIAGFPEVGSRAEAERLIAEQRVLVEGELRHKSYRVLNGMTVEIDVQEQPPEELAATDAVAFGCAYEDDTLIVVDKPAGVIVHPGAGVSELTLVQGLLSHGVAGGPDPARPGVVHRLDKDTSGLLVFAKGDAPLAALQRELKAREIGRTYIALVHGRPASVTGRIEAQIGRDPGKLTKMAVDGVGAKDAVTHFAISERLDGYTLLEVKLETGRTHQIRVHLEAIGLPVVGDPVYGRRSGAELGLERQFLHAAKLELTHPVSGERLAFESPLPPELVRALDAARG